MGERQAQRTSSLRALALVDAARGHHAIAVDRLSFTTRAEAPLGTA